MPWGLFQSPTETVSFIITGSIKFLWNSSLIYRHLLNPAAESGRNFFSFLVLVLNRHVTPTAHPRTDTNSPSYTHLVDIYTRTYTHIHIRASARFRLYIPSPTLSPPLTSRISGHCLARLTCLFLLNLFFGTIRYNIAPMTTYSCFYWGPTENWEL